MKKKQALYNSVSDMVQGLSEDRSFAEEFAKRLAGRQLIKLLTVLRTRAGLSQKDLAEKVECTQSKISKLESSADSDIDFGDLLNYTGAVGHEMRIFLVPKQQKIVDEVKMHAFFIQRLLDRMVQVAGDDGALIKAAAKFLGEAAVNLTRLVQETAESLPALPEEPASPLQVSAPEIEEERGRPRKTEAGTEERMETSALR
jgi:transcriptional regulator with XRE-family HTH domain